MERYASQIFFREVKMEIENQADASFFSNLETRVHQIWTRMLRRKEQEGHVLSDVQKLVLYDLIYDDLMSW